MSENVYLLTLRGITCRLQSFTIITMAVLLCSYERENFINGTYLSSEKSFAHCLKVNQSENEVR